MVLMAGCCCAWWLLQQQHARGSLFYSCCSLVAFTGTGRGRLRDLALVLNVGMFKAEVDYMDEVEAYTILAGPIHDETELKNILFEVASDSKNVGIDPF